MVRMIMDSLRYWVTEMGVDGFRFDLATTLLRDGHHNVTQDHPLKTAIAQDPVLADIKMIAEPWDVGPYGYQVGRFGPRWSEWNDRFRGLVRDYWRGNSDVQELAARLVGSPDLFDHDGRTAAASVNFVTAHDGFTLRDLVTYDLKHNQANGEGNRDGSDDNRSWNCGFEGETSDPGVNALRHRQAKNLLITTVLAAGVPMITAADEIGRTQDGNNNAYCQDGPISWVNWGDAETWSDLRDLTRTVLRLRRDHPVLRSDKFRHGDEVIGKDGEPTGRKNLAWFAGYPHDLQGEMTVNEWQDQSRRTLGMYIADNASDDAEGAEGADDNAADDALLIWFHAGADPVEVQLPGGAWGSSYKVLAHTGTEGELPDEPVPGDSLLTIPGRTIVILQPEA
ncbi:hypothetical protein GCM10027613_45200 [Microlunatus endophyticus]